MSRNNNTRIYIGNLPDDITSSEIEDEFSKYGNIVRCEVKKTQMSGGSFSFLQFEDTAACRDAIDDANGRRLFKNSQALRVEMPLGEGGRDRGRDSGRPPRGGEVSNKGRFLLEVKNLPVSASWQDLKDHFREVGNVCFAQVYPNRRGDGDDGGAYGEVSFNSRGEMLDAIDRLNGGTLRSHEGEKSQITIREKVPYGDGGDRGGGYSGGRGYRGGGYGGRGRHGGDSQRAYSDRPRSSHHGRNQENGYRDRSHTPPTRRSPSPHRYRPEDRRSPSYERRERSRTPERSRERGRPRSYSRERI